MCLQQPLQAAHHHHLQQLQEPTSGQVFAHLSIIFQVPIVIRLMMMMVMMMVLMVMVVMMVMLMIMMTW